MIFFQLGLYKLNYMNFCLATGCSLNLFFSFWNISPHILRNTGININNNILSIVLHYLCQFPLHFSCFFLFCSQFSCISMPFLSIFQPFLYSELTLHIPMGCFMAVSWAFHAISQCFSVISCCFLAVSQCFLSFLNYQHFLEVSHHPHHFAGISWHFQCFQSVLAVLEQLYIHNWSIFFYHTGKKLQFFPLVCKEIPTKKMSRKATFGVQRA